jgi:hypothetical protein
MLNPGAWTKHIDALRAIIRLLQALPTDCIWGLSVTEADCVDGQGVMTIYVQNEKERVHLRTVLDLGCVLDEGDNYETHRLTDIVQLSICEEN